MKTDELEALERNVAIAVKKNKLFTHKRPAEFEISSSFCLRSS